MLWGGRKCQEMQRKMFQLFHPRRKLLNLTFKKGSGIMEKLFPFMWKSTYINIFTKLGMQGRVPSSIYCRWCNRDIISNLVSLRSHFTLVAHIVGILGLEKKKIKEDNSRNNEYHHPKPPPPLHQFLYMYLLCGLWSKVRVPGRFNMLVCRDHSHYLVKFHLPDWNEWKFKGKNFLPLRRVFEVPPLIPRSLDKHPFDLLCWWEPQPGI